MITADGGYRRAKAMPPQGAGRRGRRGVRPTIEHVLVVDRLGDAAPDTAIRRGATIWWHDIVDRQSDDCPPVPVEAEHMLYLLYTSGTTAKPKGIMHTTAGYLLGTRYTHEMIFDIKPDDVYWCAADIGWVTGHSYIVYGPLANADDRRPVRGLARHAGLGPLVADHRGLQGHDPVLRAHRDPRVHDARASDYPAKHDLSSLRVMGSVGEPINPEAWLWYHEHIGGGKTPIVDTWWQTETGQILITPLPGVTTTKPGSATFPFPGIEVDVVDGDGNSVPRGGGGYLVLKRPWPGMLRGIYGDPERYKQTYWSRFPGMYFAGDGAKRDDGRLPVAAGPRGRRDERLRPPDLHDRGRVGAGRPPARRRGGRRRQEGRRHRPGDLRVRHRQGGPASPRERWPTS